MTWAGDLGCVLSRLRCGARRGPGPRSRVGVGFPGHDGTAVHGPNWTASGDAAPAHYRLPRKRKGHAPAYPWTGSGVAARCRDARTRLRSDDQRALHQCGMAREGAEEGVIATRDRKSTRLNSSHVRISYAVFCLKK